MGNREVTRFTYGHMLLAKQRFPPISDCPFYSLNFQRIHLCVLVYIYGDMNVCTDCLAD